jgi:16S rRNA (cytosine967-C5)-methyltransferase
LHRAGATNVQPMAIDSEHDRKLDRLASRADAVLVDAPCSGTGTLRRNPDLKWRGDAMSLDRLVEQQRSILSAAARLVKPGGVLVYATCSLLEDENEAQAAHFEATHPDFVREPVDAILPGFGEPGGCLRLFPHRDGVDGFFAVRWRRR